jgi:tRNA(Ile)-lysidine synthase TilS/MesJ
LKHCRVCGIPARVEGVELDEDGVCRACRRQLPHLPDPGELRERTIKELKSCDRVAVAASGGLDSLAALALAARHCREVVMLTVDTGTLHPEAWRRLHLARRRLDVEWRVVGDVDPFLRLFERRLPRAQSPCGPCSRMIERRCVRAARRLGVDALVTGHELPHGTDPVVPKDPPVIRAMCGWTERERRELVREELGMEPKKLAGYTSNCVVLPFALRRFHEEHGYSFEAPRLAAMVRLGYLGKREMWRRLEPPGEEELRGLLEECRGWIPRRLERVLRETLRSAGGPGSGG